MERFQIPKVYFILREERSSQKNSGTLFLKIYFDRKTSEISLKKQIPTKIWDKKNKRIIGNSRIGQDTIVFMQMAEAKINQIHRDLLVNNQEISASIIKDLFLGNNAKSKTLLETFLYHNQELKELEGIKYSKSTVKRYDTTYDHIKRFLKSEYNLEAISLKNLDYKFISNLEKYFRVTRKCNINSTVKYIRNMRKVINLAIKLDWIQVDPFRNFNMKLEKVEREFLTQEELNSIINYNFPVKRLQLVADLFIFACYTGLSYVDISNLKKDAIVLGIDNQQWVSIKRQKTNTPSQIPLLPPAMKIIEKYVDSSELRNENALLPVLSNQKLNSYLKEIADRCNIKKNLTFHIARHTFATSVTLANGVSMEAVSKMLGHKSISTTQIYAKIVNSQISNEMQKLRKIYKEPEEKKKYK